MDDNVKLKEPGKKLPAKKNAVTDLGAVVVKGFLGGAAAIVAAGHPMAAVVAPLFSEAVSSVIPNRRLDRIERLMATLGRQLAQSNTDQERIGERINTDTFLGLLESGFQQAARATSEARLRYIASLLHHGLTAEEIDAVLDSRLLDILGDISDLEVLILLRNALRIDEPTFHKLSVGYFPANESGYGSPTEMLRSGLRHDLTLHLANLGLLVPQYKQNFGDLGFVTQDNRSPNFYIVNGVGKELLRRIDERDVVMSE